jgi:hypothetical protein
MATESGIYDYFYWYYQNLFNRCILGSQYQTKNIRDTSGSSQIDKFVLTQEDEPIFKRFLRDSCNEVFRYLSPASKEIEGAFQYCVSLKEIIDTLKDAYGIMFILDLDDDWPQDLRSKLDADIEESIVSGVLYRWFGEIGLYDKEARELTNNQKYLKAIRSNINSRIAPVSRTHKML